MSGLMIPTTNSPYLPFAKGGKQNHDTATDLPVLTCTPLCKRGAGGDFQRGISLVELIMFIVIVSVALAGILLVFNVTTKGSADPLIHKQALAAAESLLEEIQLQDFSPPSGVASAGTMNAADDRTAGYHTVLNYHLFPLDDGMGIYPLSGGTPITGLENYRAKVTVESPLAADWNGVLAASAALITVTVYDPQSNSIEISGYRTDYCCSNVE